MRPGFITHRIMHDEIMTRDLAAAFQHGDEITMALQPFHGNDAVSGTIRQTGSCGPWRDDG
ncbi:hypothetical protein BIFANG_02250 [Bifidobacterium angulatum DSM 20098 = JCM 7096]|uniref:Uncharacterized protein n=1 Tax=Bifidobacterium angulatum DSM 20098 = JCM 7096 TaxID=518635 RepID=C4FD67_9BIFI|nr:hypothetical protein BIFANG_02250 [Bifidobacterium angulatum DSM 20098 = JCM 7096]